MKKTARNIAFTSVFLAVVFSMSAFADPGKPSPAIGLTREGTQSNILSDGNLISYPEGKILVAEAPPGGQRYILIPVVYTNCNDSIPIYSFTFSVLYNPLALQAVGVQKNGQIHLTIYALLIILTFIIMMRLIHQCRQTFRVICNSV